MHTSARRNTRVTLAMAGTLAIGLGLSACTPAPTGLSAVTSQIPSADVVALDPGAIDHALEALPAIIENALEQTGVPGAAVAVVHGDEVVFSEGYGLREAGGTETIDPETVFELASLSKPIGATVIAAQMGDGDLTWDTRIADLMPGFELADPWVSANLTLGDLYAHRSGLPHAAGDDLEDIGYDREYVLDHLWMHKLLPFRTTHKYANYSITAGAEAVAVAAGVDWSTLSEESLYAPLGMTSTSSDYADYLAQDNRASLNALVDGEFQALYERDADAQSPAGGVSSNIVDLSKWLTLMLAQGEFDGEQIVDAAALQAAMSGQIITGQPTAETRPGMYGYGFNAGVQPSGRTTASHSGAFSLGAGTNFQVVPALDLGIVVLTNGGPVGAAEAISAAFLDVVQFGEETRDWVADYAMATAGYYAPAGDLADTERPAGAAEPTELERFVGDYTNDYFGTASVALENGGLIVRLGPDGGYELPLLAWDGDTFAFVPTGENAPWGSRSSATFTETADGTTLHLQFFDSEGMGTWVR